MNFEICFAPAIPWRTNFKPRLPPKRRHWSNNSKLPSGTFSVRAENVPDGSFELLLQCRLLGGSRGLKLVLQGIAGAKQISKFIRRHLHAGQLAPQTRSGLR